MEVLEKAEYLFTAELKSLFQDRVSLDIPGCPGTHRVDQSDLKHPSVFASASRVLGLKVCTTLPSQSATDFNIGILIDDVLRSENSGKHFLSVSNCRSL